MASKKTLILCLAYFHTPAQSKSPMKSRLQFRFVLTSLLLAICAASGIGQAPAPSRKTSTPYTGDLSIFDSPGREERLQIQRVMDILGITPGKTVADIGAGSGWFSALAARRVTASGIVYAVDINPEAIAYIEHRSAKENLSNIKAHLSQPDDPNLPASSLDAALLLKTYHEVANPVTLLGHLRSALRPGSSLGIIDRNGKGTDHGVAKDVVIREATEAGFRLVNQYDFVKPDDMDYFLVFSTSK